MGEEELAGEGGAPSSSEPRLLKRRRKIKGGVKEKVRKEKKKERKSLLITGCGIYNEELLGVDYTTSLGVAFTTGKQIWFWGW